MSDDSTMKDTDFQYARDQILSAKMRKETYTKEIPSPNKFTKNSLALAAGIKLSSNTGEDIDSQSGSGRFILLHDPDSFDEWGSNFRVVIYAQAPLEEEMGSDKFISEVAWSWLLDSLKSNSANYKNISGTATNIISTGFGGLSSEGTGCVIELRASWSIVGENFSSHALAWSDLLCSLAGFPEQEGTISIDAYRIQNIK